jgi:hypothetical protein
MAVGSTNYPQPVQVNGFTCRNCTDVGNAKNHIDPAHPQSGPYGIDAATDPTNPKGFLQSRDSAKTAKSSTQSGGRLLDIQA